jgi:hypothetical protein
LTAHWLALHDACRQHHNPSPPPPNWEPLPPTLEYLRIYFQEGPYIRSRRDTESITKYRRLIYNTQRYKQLEAIKSSGLRVQNKFPHIHWTRVWSNINKPFLPRSIRTTWYTIIHDILPTNARLKTINLHEDGRCKQCAKYDTALHRYTACTDAQIIWDWTKKRLATYMRTDSHNIPDNWICFPDFKIHPLQRQNATIWILGHMIGYIHNNPTLTLQDYLDFMRRERWREQRLHSAYKNCGRYLDVLDY